MCYTAIPGQTGIRAARDYQSAQQQKVVTPKLVIKISLVQLLRRPTETPVFSGERLSMSHDVIAGRGDSRRYRRFDDRRGKRMAKRLHKPEWRGYEKY